MTLLTIEAPLVTGKPRGGLMGVANVIDNADGSYTYNGVTYETALCGPNRRIPAEGEDKTFDMTGTNASVNFGVYRGIEVPILTKLQDAGGLVTTAFNNGESWAVERAIQELVLNASAVDITPTVGTPVTNMKRAIGLLEQYAQDNYVGLPLIHGNRIATTLIPDIQVDSDTWTLHTMHGTPVANGGGYYATGPDGEVAAAGEAWLFVTGQVNIWRGALNVYTDAHALKQNRTFALAERTYTATVECITAAILVGNT